MDELNKTLAEWAGFKETAYHESGMFAGHHRYSHPNGTVLIDFELPDFTESLDACFKWLVPKLEPLGYDLGIGNDLEMLGWSVCLHNTKSECSIASPMEHCELKDIAITLCKVIEKLVLKDKK